MSDRFDLRPNETRKLDLVMRAVKAGAVENLVRAVGDANLVAEHRTNLEVIAPQLEVGVAGPSRRYLQRQVTYQISVSNPGTAPAHDIELVAFLPQGLKFVGTEKKGQYDQSKHAVYWNLEELPAGEPGALPDAKGPEWVSLVLLSACLVLFGLLPALALSRIDPAVVALLDRLGVVR